MINNPAVMGAVGVILGAIISGVINYMNGKQYHKLQKEQSKIEKIEKAAIDFLVLMQKVFTFNLLMQSKSGNEMMLEKLNTEIITLNEQVKAKMRFYFEKDDYDLAMEICAMAKPESEEEAQLFNKLRVEKTDILLNNINKKIKNSLN